MNIETKLGFRKKRRRMPTTARKPCYTEVRPQSLATLYSYKDFLIDILRHYTINQRLYHPHLPTLIVEFIPIYNWSNSKIRSADSDQRDEKVEEAMNVDLSHCDTIVSNGYQKFGAVLGSKLDPRLDHVINVRLVGGIEFGVGICNEKQVKMTTRRDFMCIEGGYGYYNYKTKSAHKQPKYPPGLYYQVKTCHKIRKEADILHPGDVLTMVIQRENVTSPGGGNIRSKFGSDRDLIFNPMSNLKASSRYILSFYKNGEDMNFHIRNLEGPFYLCLNYYFVGSKIRLLSDYNFRNKHHQQRVRRLRVDQETQRMISNGLRSSVPNPKRHQGISFRPNWRMQC